MRTYTLALLMLLITSAAEAQYLTDRYVLPCCSYHAEGGKNGFNIGFGKEWYTSGNRLLFSAFGALNSYYDPTLYLTASWHPLQIVDVGIGATGLCAYGYEKQGWLCAGPAPSIEYRYSKDLAFDSIVYKGFATLRLKVTSNILEGKP